MFTGIVTDIGEVVDIRKSGDTTLRIACSYDPDSIEIGASIACEGVCLTVTALGAEPRPWFEVQASAETLALTTIGQGNGWGIGQRLNLERALKVGDELGGHIVSGHVDGMARVTGLRDEGDSLRISFEAPEALAKFIAPKGSVALNGTSLTVNEVDGTRFGINLIPHTRSVTTWGAVEEGDAVNLEVDTMARYVARLQEAG
ncbi:riboflavin synthase [Pseudoroseicyclus aestuarii]|uniref:Riboflavin synthase n=1 Tax=Pseudoroseicyclus aestuarii TaxID=1795041 RepID=A0A318SX59_9RHOB|nr:riboflavin synthase [Pseudoroseicyclus aestuarii]PYE85925.1 riboflavin synthase alpha chain [Pseudoroseicyclus aestuarii]